MRSSSKLLSHTKHRTPPYWKQLGRLKNRYNFYPMIKLGYLIVNFLAPFYGFISLQRLLGIWQIEVSLFKLDIHIGYRNEMEEKRSASDAWLHFHEPFRTSAREDWERVAGHSVIRVKASQCFKTILPNHGDHY